MGVSLAHNTITTAPGVPVVIEDDTYYPFAPGERESEWHEASEEEYAAYAAYWADREGAE